jgi:hypothetical protein
MKPNFYRHRRAARLRISQSYEKIEELNPFPAGKQDLIPLALAIAIPAFPVIIAQIPVAIVLQDLLRALR